MKAKRIDEVLTDRQKEKFQKKSDLDTKRFLAMVKDEWDIESLDLMIEIISKRKEFLQSLVDQLNPRPKVRGFMQNR